MASGITELVFTIYTITRYPRRLKFICILRITFLLNVVKRHINLQQAPHFISPISNTSSSSLTAQEEQA